MRHFVLSGPKQVHDVHSRLRLQHPRGKAVQLHKCIVSASSGAPCKPLYSLTYRWRLSLSCCCF